MGAPERWDELCRHVMSLDHSWQSSAQQYDELYKTQQRLAELAAADAGTAEAQG